MKKKFWIVMGKPGLSTNPYRHESLTSAFTESERLCRLHGGTFYVLEAVGDSSKVDVKVERYEEEPPF